MDSKSCVVSGYITKSSVRAFVNKKLRKSKLQTECVLNNKLKKKIVYALHIFLNYSNKQNAQSTGTTIPQVVFFLRSCPLFNLDRRHENELCRMKWDDKKNLKQLQKFYSKFRPESVAKVYMNCPKKRCNIIVANKICSDKQQGKSLTTILSKFLSYQTNCMRKIFHNCRVKLLTDPGNHDVFVLCYLVLCNLYLIVFQVSTCEPIWRDSFLTEKV